jgi:putative ABC transport system permease protein
MTSAGASTMPIRPILSALWRRKTGAVLIAAQVALTLAILCNALFIVFERTQRAGVPTGVAESEVFYVSMVTPGYDANPFDSQRRDEALVRAVPGVRAVTWANQMPLSQSGNSTSIPIGDGARALNTAVYAGASLVETLGLRLVEGRDFRPDEILDVDRRVTRDPPQQAIITRTVAERLFPQADTVVGRTLSFGNGRDDVPITVVGVVERLTSPWGPRSWSPEDPDGEASLISPARNEERGMIVVRADPGQIDRVRQAVIKVLKSAEPGRIVVSDRSMTETRDRRYRNDTWLAGLLTVVIGLLLTMTAAGIVGLSSLWVTQRRKQIGVRRALGARRADIVKHFLIENLMITSLGVAIGLTLAVGLNHGLTQVTALSPLPPAVLAGGAAAMLVLGALAVLGPALRAARVPPAEATRSV